MTTVNANSSFTRKLAESYPIQARHLVGDPISISIYDQDAEDRFHGTCEIHSTAADLKAGKFTLVLDSIPFDEDVEGLVWELDGVCENSRTGRTFKIPIRIDSAPKIRKLARIVHKVIGRGKRYLDSNWRWQAPTIARSLEFFAKVLAEGYRESRGLSNKA